MTNRHLLGAVWVLMSVTFVAMAVARWKGGGPLRPRVVFAVNCAVVAAGAEAMAWVAFS